MATTSPTGQPAEDDAAGEARWAGLWSRIDELTLGASLEGIQAHKLGPLVAVRRRSLGYPVPQALVDEERAAVFAMLSGSALLERIRQVVDGPLMIFKGPEVAVLYPQGGRRFGDIDILVPDAAAAHRALRASGFVEVEGGFDHSVHHHLIPLRWHVSPLHVEIHASPNWPPRLQPPSIEQLFAEAVSSKVAVNGLSAPDPLHHTLLLAAHAWRHEPLQALRDLVDVAVMSAGIDGAELDRVAASWGLARIWGSTKRAVDALFYGGPTTIPLLIWARHLAAVRERTVFESHLQRVLQPFSALPPGCAILEAMESLRIVMGRAEDEGWGEKLRRVPRAIIDAGAPVSRRQDSNR